MARLLSSMHWLNKHGYISMAGLPQVRCFYQHYIAYIKIEHLHKIGHSMVGMFFPDAALRWMSIG